MILPKLHSDFESPVMQAHREPIDILVGVKVSRLPKLSPTALRPTPVSGDAIAAFVKMQASTMKMATDKLRVMANSGDSLHWQMTSVSDQFEYEVAIYDIRFEQGSGLSRAKSATIEDALEHMQGMAWIAPLNYFTSDVVSVSDASSKCEVLFKVVRKRDNSLIGYGAWQPELCIKEAL